MTTGQRYTTDWTTEMRISYAENVLSKSVLPLLDKEPTPTKRRQIREFVTDAATVLNNALEGADDVDLLYDVTLYEGRRP